VELSGAAFATAVAAADSLIAVFRFLNSAAPPETNGALNDVPHPAAYVAKGYVVTISSPGAATHTMAFPKFENVDRLPSVALVEPTDATPITSFCSAAG
jgi:hypothetical protein